MKVAVLIDTWFPHIGGGQINAWEISRRIAQDGMRVEIITRNNGRESLKLPKNLAITKLGGYSQPESLLARLNFLIKAFFYITKQNFNLVHAHAFLPGIIARILMVTKGIPAILTVHGTSINTNLLNPLAKFIEKFILTEVLYSAQITVSRDFLTIKNKNRKIFYIPNAVNVSDFDRVKTVKSKLPTLIFVGRLHPQKNLLVLLQAIKKVSRDRPDIRLEIVGNGPQKAELAKAAKDLKLTKYVTFHGEISGRNLVKLYKSSHIFILPSIYEGQPLTLLEAWAAKLPVIVTKTGDCQFLVKNGRNGYLIKDSTSVNEIAKIIRNALAGPTLAHLGQNGYNLVRKNFSWEKSAQETLRAYESLTSSQN